MWIYSDQKSRLTNRYWKEKKREHFSNVQIAYIIRQRDRFPKSIKLMQKKYRLSRFTLRRITQFKNTYKFCEDKPLVRHRGKRRISKEAELAVRSYLSPPCEPRSIPIIKKHIESKLKECYSTQEIRNYIKNEMKYTYKKGNSRPPVYTKSTTQFKKALFCTELLSLIADGNVVINWDESSFDRSVKQEYSWLPAGQSCKIINDRLKGRASLILATWMTGEWLAMIVTSTVNSEKCWFFLKLLSSIINRSCSNIHKSPVIVIDNASTHLSGLIRR